MKIKRILFILLIVTLQPVFGQKPKKTELIFVLSTKFGKIEFILFDQTPKHKANFTRLVEQHFFDSITFHRVLKNFVIQGGDPNTKPGGDTSQIGNGGPGYEIDAEIVPEFKHLKGYIGAARQGDDINPQRRSSGSQFYIVQKAEGTPHLDGKYTVFGKVVSGMDVVDKIASVEVNKSGRPYEPIRMAIRAHKVKVKKMFKLYGIKF